MRFKTLDVVVSLLAISLTVAACDSDGSPWGTPCTPEGIYALEKSVYSAGGGFCAALAQDLNGKAKAEEVACTKLDATTYETRNPADPGDTPKRQSLDSTRCELSSTSSQSITTISSGTTVNLIFVDQKIFVTPTGLTRSAEVRVSTTSSGVNGLPCSMTVVQEGTKK
ncbi:MAG TPA: hypothetical protein VM925_20090 [Labilithrix sp.]|nr:hypothetical protein [Labilithrix sp.]